MRWLGSRQSLENGAIQISPIDLGGNYRIGHRRWHWGGDSGDGSTIIHCTCGVGEDADAKQHNDNPKLNVHGKSIGIWWLNGAECSGLRRKPEKNNESPISRLVVKPFGYFLNF